MKDFLAQNKIFLIVTITTLILIIGGVYLFSRNGTTNNPAKVSDTILFSPNSFKTSGIQNGNYLPVSQNAKATLVEFGDYQCPACGAYHPLVKQLLTEMSGQVNFVFRNFPLTQHQNSHISA